MATDPAGARLTIDLQEISVGARRGRAPTPARRGSALWAYEGSTAQKKLANREVMVLRLVASGLSNKEIARQLGISHKTVRNHMSAVFFKLGVNNRTQAVLYAVRSGFFSV